MTHLGRQRVGSDVVTLEELIEALELYNDNTDGGGPGETVYFFVWPDEWALWPGSKRTAEEHKREFGGEFTPIRIPGHSQPFNAHREAVAAFERLGLRIMNPPRAARSATKTNPDPEYTHFILLPHGEIESGWHFREDAVEYLKDEHGRPQLSGARVVARRTLKSMGIDPDSEFVWATNKPTINPPRRRPPAHGIGRGGVCSECGSTPCECSAEVRPTSSDIHHREIGPAKFTLDLSRTDLISGFASLGPLKWAIEIDKLSVPTFIRAAQELPEHVDTIDALTSCLATTLVVKGEADDLAVAIEPFWIELEQRYEVTNPSRRRLNPSRGRR